MLPPLLMPLLERLRRRQLHLRRDSVDVVRALQEVLEELEEALADGAAELGRLQVGEVEAERLRVREAGCRLRLDLVRVRALVDVLVRRREAALLRPDLR